MSTFTCPKCGALIEDSPSGYLTGCEHYPIEGAAAAPVPTPRELREELEAMLDAASQEKPE